MIKRSQPIKRSAAPKRSNPARKRRERARVYGPKGYVEWLHGQECAACFVTSGSECAHIRTGGTGRKDDWTRTVPLCGPQMNGWLQEPGCHRILHHIGRYAFEDRFGIDLDAAAKATNLAWLAHSNPATPPREPK